MGGGRCSRLGVGIRLEEGLGIDFGILGVAVLNVAVLIGNMFAYAPRTRIHTGYREFHLVLVISGDII